MGMDKQVDIVDCPGRAGEGDADAAAAVERGD